MEPIASIHGVLVGVLLENGKCVRSTRLVLRVDVLEIIVIVRRDVVA